MIIRGVTLTGTFVADLPSVVTNGLKINLDASTYVSGTTWADTSGNSNNYTLVNSPTWSNTNQGIFTFNGSTQYVNSPDLNTPYAMGTASTPFTFEVWAKPSGTTNSGVLLDETGNVLQNGWHDSYMEFAGGNIRISTWSNSTGVSLGSYTANNWYQIVMAFTGSTLTGYVNNVQQYTSVWTRTGGGAAMFYPLGLGDVTSLGNGAFFSGSIGAMRFYNRAITAAEVNQNFYNLRYRYGI